MTRCSGRRWGGSARSRWRLAGCWSSCGSWFVAAGSPELISPEAVAGPLIDAMEQDQLTQDIRAELLDWLASTLGDLGREAAPQAA